MGHVTANHGLERQKKEAEEQLASQVVNDVLGKSAMARAALVRGKLRMAQFSRNQELEADIIGIKAIGEAGYDPYAAARFLQSMAAYQDFHSVGGAHDPSLDFLASHPNAPQRIELAKRQASQFGPPGTGERDRDEYLAGIDGMMFGDTPEEGYVRGHDFLHPRLGVAFSVPDGFVIDNSAAAVTASGPGDVAVRFDGVSVPRGKALTDYLTSGWVSGLERGTVHETVINGNEAANAHATADGWQFDVTVIRAGDQVYRLLTAAPLSSDQLDSVARYVTGSFHLLSDAEKARLRPLRIRIRTVRPGETTATYASQMVGVDRKLELFQLLNALGPGATLRPGDKVKIVTDR
jgi:predicted Zn-dependent protease